MYDLTLHKNLLEWQLTTSVFGSCFDDWFFERLVFKNTLVLSGFSIKDLSSLPVHILEGKYIYNLEFYYVEKSFGEALVENPLSNFCALKDVMSVTFNTLKDERYEQTLIGFCMRLPNLKSISILQCKISLPIELISKPSLKELEIDQELIVLEGSTSYQTAFSNNRLESLIVRGEIKGLEFLFMQLRNLKHLAFEIDIQRNWDYFLRLPAVVCLESVCLFDKSNASKGYLKFILPRIAYKCSGLKKITYMGPELETLIKFLSFQPNIEVLELKMEMDQFVTNWLKEINDQRTVISISQNLLEAESIRVGLSNPILGGKNNELEINLFGFDEILQKRLTSEIQRIIESPLI